MKPLATIEQQRQRKQACFDDTRTAAQRNRLGQFATPPELADDIARYVRGLRHNRSDKLRFLDPAIGTGAFYSAIRKTFGAPGLQRATGVEIDSSLANAARALWADTGLEVICADFTRLPPPGECERYDLVLANPPYVRHHHLSVTAKRRLRDRVAAQLGLAVSGLAGLYVYFLLLADAWLEEDGFGVWLIPSEFMNVNYGAVLREYFCTRVELLHVHCFNATDVQFCDALVTSAVVIFRKRAEPPSAHRARLTFGGSLRHPECERHVPLHALQASRKWGSWERPQQDTRSFHECGPSLGDLFSIKRGIATGANSFFILPRTAALERGIPPQALRPVLPSPRYLTDCVIERDEDGWPRLPEQLALIDCDLGQEDIRRRFPRFWGYLLQGQQEGIDKRYLTSRRSPWYCQERRPPAPFLCTYMGRTSRDGEGPFRFFWNKSDAIAANVYLMLYPRGQLRAILTERPDRARDVLEALRQVGSGTAIEGSRTYGGGLHKVEPRELACWKAEAIFQRIRDLRPTSQFELGFGNH